MPYQLGIGLIASLFAGACVTRGDLEEIKQQQKEILGKLDRAGAQPQPQERPQGPDPTQVYAYPVGDSPVKGGNDAWVTIVEVSDFQCPFCSRVNPTLKEIEEKYGRDVRFVFKHNALPFHQRAKPAARAAECAKEQGRFWQMHDLMFANQQQLEDAQLDGYARQAGVDASRWKSCVEQARPDARIDADQQLANQMGARGTPAFFINGRFLSGAQPLPAFTAVIDEELKKAKDSGILAREYYQKAVVEKGRKAM